MASSLVPEIVFPAARSFAASSHHGGIRLRDQSNIQNTIGVADELPVHYRGGVGKSGGGEVGELEIRTWDQIGTVLWY